MKNFISKQWRNIIFFFTGLAILINLINVSITPATVVEDYYKYGPTYSYEFIPKDIDIDIEENIDDTAISMSDETGIDGSLARNIIIIAILIVLLLVFGNIIDGGSAPAKKK